MAETPSTPTGEHTPVSNEPEEAPAPEQEMRSDPPSEGLDPDGGAVTEEGLEVVEGYTPPSTEMAMLSAAPEAGRATAAQRRALAEVPKLWMAPDTSALSDVGEASFGAPPRLEVVIGTDDRVQITGTSSYPWRVHAPVRLGDQHQLPVRHGVDGQRRSELRLRSHHHPLGAGGHHRLVRLRRVGRLGAHRVGGEHLWIAERQAVGYPVVPRQEDRIGQYSEGLLRHRHSGRPERQR